MKLLLATLLTLLPHTLAGEAIIKNRCPIPLYITTVSSKPLETISVPPAGYYLQPLFSSPTAGVAIKITTSRDGLSNGSPILHLSYTLNKRDNTLFYDLSSVYGWDEVFRGKKVVVRTNEEKKCPRIVWEGRMGEGSTRSCPGVEGDLWMDLCA